MPLELVDTHCHLDGDPLGAQVESVLNRARAAGVSWCVTIGTTAASSRDNVELARRFPMLRAAVGIHPHEAGSVTDETFGAIEELSHAPGVVAIGEVGLDFYRQHADAEHQREALVRFATLAKRRNLPILLHCRDAYDEMLKLLRSIEPGPWRGVIHCASGPPAFIEGALAMGFWVSFSGTVTFSNAHAVRELVPLVPDDRLLIETDAPFLAPQPVRGQMNEPAHLAHTAAFLARLRGVSLEQLGAVTSRNARTLFGLAETRNPLTEGCEAVS